MLSPFFFFFQAEDGIRDLTVTGVQTCALPIAFALLATACVAGGAAYTAWAALRTRSGTRPGDGGGHVAVEDAAAARTLIGRSGPMVMFRNTGLGQGWEQVALEPTESPDQPRTIVPLRCQRLHFAAGRGLCVTGHAGFFSTYDVYTFGADFALSHKMSLTGLPSRTRVSPDGRYGAITVFVAGHSYAAASFSTTTMLLDLA